MYLSLWYHVLSARNPLFCVEHNSAFNFRKVLHGFFHIDCFGYVTLLFYLSVLLSNRSVIFGG